MKPKLFFLSVITLSLGMTVPPDARAHCDTMDGPVVTDAKQALDKGEVTAVLKWVKQQDESVIRTAFKKTLAVRKQSAEAKELADMYFCETLVRVHRTGEGEPFTGLKPAGSVVEPGIAAADKAIESGKVDGLTNELTENVTTGVRQRHQRVIETKKHAEESVAAGREYVAAYVEFIHYVERVHQAVAPAAGPLHAEEKTAHEHH